MEKLIYEEVKKEADLLGLSCGEAVGAAKKELLESAGKYHRTWVVLDDDPTGIQTVHDVAVYTHWDKETLKRALVNEKGLFYILTNSRGMTSDESRKLHLELMDDLIKASKETGVDFDVISRSDSTLRGHFPLETDIISNSILKEQGQKTDGLILAPFFQAGGRITVSDVHYVRYQNELVPAADTEFAKDETFGYENSDLKKYIEEKTSGKVKAGSVISIPLEILRRGDVEGAQKMLMQAKDNAAIIVNAFEPVDLEVFGAALYRCLRAGKRYVYRTAADFVKAVGAVSDKPLLDREALKVTSDRGGIVMVGSHTDKTTRQLKKLESIKGLEFIEYDSDKVLDDSLADETKRVSAYASYLIKEGKTVVVYTRRKVLSLPGDTREQALLRSVKISDAFTEVVGKLTERPAFIVGKGGITSSDIGTKALLVKRAVVLGQIQPGVPVWETDESSRFPGIPYVIFPGNVGDDETLYNAVKVLA